MSMTNRNKAIWLLVMIGMCVWIVVEFIAAVHTHGCS